MSSRLLPLALVLIAAVVSAPLLDAEQSQRRAAPPAPTPLFEVHERSILELQAAQTQGRVTSRGLVQSYLARIAAYDQAGPALNAIVLLNPKALEDADALDRERAARGPRGPLHGIPILVKDNYDTAGMPTSGGALALAQLQPAADAFQVAKLRAAGAVILGKTTMHELAAGITTIASLTGQTRNPYDLMRVPGGSSGGTGAGVAASFAAAGMGSDTCGSIRIPAANQNLVGLRATRGLSSRTGVMPLSDTQDVAGPLARSVTDLALVLDATVGPDPADPVTSDAAAHVPRSYRDGFARATLKGTRIGVLRALFGTAPEDDEVGGARAQGARGHEGAGRRGGRGGRAGHGRSAEREQRHRRRVQVRSRGLSREAPGRAREVARRDPRPRPQPRRARGRRSACAISRPGATREHYRQALVKRRALREAVVSTLEGQKLDVLAYPTLRRKPTLIGEAQIGTTCQLSATTGLPAISMPAGFTVDGLPIGIELLGPAFSEAALLERAYAWEQAASPRRAPFSTPPLVDGAAPGAAMFGFGWGVGGVGGGSVQFRYAPTTAALHYAFSIVGDDSVLAVALHRMDGERVGPIVAHLGARGQRKSEGTVMLRGRDREDFLAGRLGLRVYSGQQPLGGGVTRLAPP